MKQNLWVVLAVVAVWVSGCSSVPTRVDKGPVRASTYSFMPSKAPASVVVTAQRREAHERIQAAISKDLAQKGLKQVATGGEVQVGYLIVVGDNATTVTYDEYFGYGRDAAALSEKAHKALAEKKSRDYFEVGALVIDVVASGDSKLLYRSYVLTDVQEMNPGNRDARISSLVASCLGNLKVAR